MDDDCASVHSRSSKESYKNSIDYLITESPEKEKENTEHSKLDSNDTEEKEQIQPNRASPEPACSICLGSLQDKCYTDSCSHTFCFTCLLEWSKVKAECPLCKVTFKSIVHNVRSNDDFDQYYVQSSSSSSGSTNSERTAHFYRRQTRALNIALLRLNPAISSGIEQQRITYAPHSMRGVSDVASQVHIHSPRNIAFRQRVYRECLWAKQFSSPPRHTTPEFYQSSPACTHRLVPWLTRELQALLNDEQRVSFVLDFIMAIILRYDIKSEEFFLHTQSYLGGLTSHFVHEFYAFASSRYDINEYDMYVEYDARPPTTTMLFASGGECENVIFLSSGESGDDDVTIETPSTSFVIHNSSQYSIRRKRYPVLQNSQSPIEPSMESYSPHLQQNYSSLEPYYLSPPYSPREACYSPASSRDVSPLSTCDSPLPCSSSASEKRVPKLSLKKNHKSNSWDVRIATSSPTSVSSSAQNLDISNCNAGTSADDCLSILAEAAKIHSTKKSPINITLSSDDSEVEIVAELKPKRLRTPELVDLCSDSEKVTEPLEDLEPISDGSLTVGYSDSENTSANAHKVFEYSSDDKERCLSDTVGEKGRNKRKHSRYSTDHRHRHHSRKECHSKSNSQCKKKHSSDRHRRYSSSPAKSKCSSSPARCKYSSSPAREYSSPPGRNVRIRLSSSSSEGKGPVRLSARERSFRPWSPDFVHRKNSSNQEKCKFTPTHEISDNRNVPDGCTSPVPYSSSVEMNNIPLFPDHNSSSSDSHEYMHKHRSHHSSSYKKHKKNKRKHDKHKRKR